MTFSEFKSSVDPKGFSVELEALWYDGKGDWNRSHEVIQDVNSKNAAWIHAYLHRKEGDLGNAQYWYSRAGKTMPEMSLEEEWRSLVEHFLKN
jgi:hypothetical protein